MRTFAMDVYQHPTLQQHWYHREFVNAQLLVESYPFLGSAGLLMSHNPFLGTYARLPFE